MDFFEENELERKKIVLLDYVLNHYQEKGFWCFEIALAKEYQFLFEDAENNNIGTIFSKNNKIILDSLNIYFILDSVSTEAIKAFNNNEPFYFRMHNEKLDFVDSEIINVLAINNLTLSHR